MPSTIIHTIMGTRMAMAIHTTTDTRTIMGTRMIMDPATVTTIRRKIRPLIRVA